MILEQKLKAAIRDIADFPKDGIIFRDITPLLANPILFKEVVQVFADEFKNKNITKIVGVESRGFIFGVALAYAMGLGFVPIRKKGKLPYKTYAAAFALEYGTDTIEIHQDALTSADSVLIVDDLLATGGTIKAALKLVQGCGAKTVACAFLAELACLKGRDGMAVPIKTLIKF